MEPNSPKLSIVICMYNEVGNVIPLLERLDHTLSALNCEYIFVDDGSTDDTLQALKDNLRPDMRIVELRKNYGQSLALAAGIEETSGDFIVTIDGDLQNDPVDIPRMLQLAQKEGWDVVAGYRENRKDKVFLRKIPSRIAGALIRWTMGVDIRDFGCTLRLYRAEIARDLKLYGQMHRFISILVQLDGARLTEVPVNHHPRIHGKSKYGLGRTFRVMSDLMLMLFFKRYMQRPMHLFGSLGLILFIAGLIINLYLLWIKIQGGDIWGKPLLLLGITLLLAGIQLITFGIFVELQLRTYYESQEKRPYKVRNVYSGSVVEKRHAEEVSSDQ
jgi:glycosyltransferase involved in cell wall biosynthesis